MKQDIRAVAEEARQARLAGRPASLTSLPNQITLWRTVLACCAFGFADGTGSLFYLGWTVYWLGDLADGFAARRADLETRFGAVLDSLCDRLCMASLLMVLLDHGVREGPALAFGALFVTLDLMLSLVFLYFPLLSPIYFWLIDNRVYRLNWSPAAKAASVGPCVIFIVMDIDSKIIYAVVASLLFVKLYSLVRVARLIKRRGPDGRLT